jgi:hypothetical protein
MPIPSALSVPYLPVSRSSDTVCGGRTPLGLLAPPTHLPQERGGSIIICGVCVSGRDEVRTFGAWWELETYKTLPHVSA